MKQNYNNSKRHANSVVDEQALSEVRALLGDMPRRRDLLIECLHRLQDHFHCLTRRHIRALARELKLAQTEVYEVATFYHHFDVIDEDREAPPPELTVRVCESLTCEMFGSKALLQELQAQFGDRVRVQAVPCWHSALRWRGRAGSPNPAKPACWKPPCRPW